MKTGAVIAAAGMGRRMGQFKQLIKVGDLSLAERVVVGFVSAGIRDIVVVTGYNAAELEMVLSGYGVTFIRNEDYENTQMLDSVKLGLDYYNGNVDRVFYCPADVPFFKPDTVKRLTETEGMLVCPSYKGKLGHPMCMDAKLIPKILAFNGDGGLKGAFIANGIKPVPVEIEDEGVVSDADTPADIKKLEMIYSDRRG